MIIRKATLQDIDILIKLRFDYLAGDFGNITQNEKEIIHKNLTEYYELHIQDNTFIAVIAEVDGIVASTAFLAMSEKPASPAFITGKTGTILNVLTYPKYRRKGIATKVITCIIEEARKMGVSSIELSATSDGKPLYEKLGFMNSKYSSMRMKTK